VFVIRKVLYWFLITIYSEQCLYTVSELQRLWRQASISIRDPLENLEGGSSTGGFESWMKGALSLTGEGLKGRHLY